LASNASQSARVAVAQHQECCKRAVQFGIISAETVECPARGLAIQRVRVLGRIEDAAEFRRQRHLASDAQAERVDGLNVETLRLLEQSPARARRSSRAPLAR
jgi:hypothetical protein